MGNLLTQISLPADLAHRYEELARYTGQRREEMMVAVLEAYLAEVGEEDARIEAASAVRSSMPRWCMPTGKH